MKPLWQRAPRHKRVYRGPARDKAYLRWIRTLPCLICGRGSEAAHTGRDGGMSQKSSDYSAVPLCSDHHTQAGKAYHRGTRRQFEKRYGIDLVAVTQELKTHYERKTMPHYVLDRPELVHHHELLMLQTFISEATAEIEHSLDEVVKEDSNGPDWQFLRGQQSALREVSKKIRDIMESDDRQYDRFRLTPAGEVKPVGEEAA